MAKKRVDPKLSLLFGRFTQKTVISVGFVGILGLFAVLQLFWNIQLQWRIESLEARNMASMIIQSAEELDRPLRADPASGNQYVPQSRLMLPPAYENLEVAYMELDGASIGFKSRANVQTAAGKMMNARNVSEVFEVVPQYQICNRQVVLRYDAIEDPKYLLKGTKALSDGRVASIYEETGCPADASRLANFLMQVESY